MKPQVKIAEAFTPEGDLLELYEHDEDLFICSNGQHLMTSRAYGSEEEWPANLLERPGSQ